MATEDIPANVRKLLAKRMKELRDNMTQPAAVKALKALDPNSTWSTTKLSKIENNQARVHPDEVEDLFTVYGHDDPEELAKLKRWAKAARRKGHWQQKIPDLPENVNELVAAEARASQVRIWQLTFVPALCQTPDYAEAVISGMEADLDEDEVKRRVAARMTRQEVLTRDEDPLQLIVVLDELVLRRPIGSAAVRIGQLLHLIRMVKSRVLKLRVVPTSVGAHLGLAGWFELLTFSNPDEPDIVYTDGEGGSLYIEEGNDVQASTLKFGQLQGIALSQEESITLINSMIGELSQESE